jgi:hypothetical protein
VRETIANCQLSDLRHNKLAIGNRQLEMNRWKH